jgi:hypothetical protein
VDPISDARALITESLRFRDWPVELFVQTPAMVAAFRRDELAARKPSLHRMIAQGVPLAGDPSDVMRECAQVLAEGPPPLTARERDRWRYGLTYLLDDHRHALDKGERMVIAAALWTESARALLAFERRWISSGKWLLRELKELDDDLATRWLAARDDPALFAAEVLDRAGGPLFDGYRAGA